MVKQNRHALEGRGRMRKLLEKNPARGPGGP